MGLAINRITATTLCASLWIASASAAPLPADGSRTVDRTLAAKAHGEVDLRSSAGTILVIGEERTDARLQGTLGRDVRDLEIFQDGRYIRIVAHPPAEPPEAPSNLASELTLRVPKGTSLNIQTIEAETRVKGIEGRLRLESAVGSIDVEGGPRSIYAVTVSGDMTIDVHCPDAELKTITGDLEIAGEIESLIAESVESRIRSSAGIEVEGRLRTVTGSIELAGEPAETARAQVQTSSGSVQIGWSRELEGHFTLRTETGEIEQDAGPPAESVDGRQIAKWSRGEAPRRLHVDTLSGEIRWSRSGD